MKLSDEARHWLYLKIRQKCRTVRSFAKKVNLSESAVCRILKGNRNMMAYHYTNFANVLGMTVEDFEAALGVEEDEHRD